MKYSVLSILSCIFTFFTTTISASESEIFRTRALLPRAPLVEIYNHAVRNLDEEHPLVRDLYNHITVVARGIKDRRMALPLAHAEALARAEAEPKGGGGLKAAGSAAKKADKGGGSGGGGSNGAPPGLSADGKKAWDQCQAASNTGDCGAMKGMFAEMGCTLGSLHGTKACENGNVQDALKKMYCGKHPGSKGC